MTKEIFKLYAQGKTYTQIAERVGTTRNVVAGTIYRAKKKAPCTDLGIAAWWMARGHL